MGLVVLFGILVVARIVIDHSDHVNNQTKDERYKAVLKQALKRRK